MTHCIGESLPLPELWSVFHTYRFTCTSEATLAAGIAKAFRTERIEFEAEVVLDARSRIDFLLAGGLGIELKVKGSATEVLAQLMRYADFEQIKSLLLVTTRAKHLDMPDTVRGKPLRVHFIGGIS